MQPTNLNGQPYTPRRARRWITDANRASLAEAFECEPEQVEFCLDRRDEAHAYMAERAERENPFTHRRPGARALSYAEMVY